MPKTSPVNSRLYPGSTPKLDVFLLESLPGGVETQSATTCQGQSCRKDFLAFSPVPPTGSGQHCPKLPKELEAPAPVPARVTPKPVTPICSPSGYHSTWSSVAPWRVGPNCPARRASSVFPAGSEVSANAASWTHPPRKEHLAPGGRRGEWRFPSARMELLRLGQRERRFHS